MELREKMYLNIFVLFIVDPTSILKLVFPTIYYFCLDGYFGGCVVAIIVIVVVVVFIYLFIYLFIDWFIDLFIFAASTVILIFFVVVVITTVAFVAVVIVAFFVCWVIGVANLMLMFSILVLLYVPYFTVNSVDK